jgi:hypothetical protein
MKKHILYSGAMVLASLVIAATLMSARHPAAPQTDNSQELRELRTRIAQIEAKTAAVQKELGQVHKQIPTLIYTPVNESSSQAPAAVAREQIPPGWKAHEFNGLTYYFTPLGQGTEISMSPAQPSETLLVEPSQNAK